MEPGCLFPHQCRKFMIISTRAIPAYQKSSCIQNVAHDLVGQTSLGITFFLSFDKISSWPSVSLEMDISMMSGKLRSKTVWLCLAGCWNWNHQLAWLVLFIGIYLVCLLFVCILFAVCPGKDLFAGRPKPGKSSWNCKPSWDSACLDETQMCKFGHIHLPIWTNTFCNLEK